MPRIIAGTDSAGTIHIDVESSPLPASTRTYRVLEALSSRKSVEIVRRREAYVTVVEFLGTRIATTALSGDRPLI
jgi:hypothetical protein